MVRYISFGFVIIIGMLAMISRKNYSKYKQGVDILFSLSEAMLHYTPPAVLNKVRMMIRKTNVLNTQNLEDTLSEYMIGLYHTFLLGLVIVLLISGGITFIPEKEQDLYTIKRPDTGDSPIYVDMELRSDAAEDVEDFSLEVNPKEYTDSEFEKECEQAKSYIDSCILGNNTAADKVMGDLTFPEKDESGNLKIVWSTSEPDVISTVGTVSNRFLKEPVEVTVTADIKDDNHTDTYTKDVVVVKDDSLTSSEKAKVSILNIEEMSRTEKELVLPQELEGVKIIREEDREKKYTAVFFLGIITLLLIVYRKLQELNDTGEKRDEQLEDAYYSFVNRLAIHIGAGLNLRDAMRRAAEVERSDYLKKEVGFALNRVASGVKEASVYMDLGKSLGTQEYMRLMSLLSQNLAYGNSNLIGLLDSEVKQSFYIKREHIRKKGEQASEKLLLPTAILLVLVIVIVMYPAFINL